MPDRADRPRRSVLAILRSAFRDQSKMILGRYYNRLKKARGGQAGNVNRKRSRQNHVLDCSPRKIRAQRSTAGRIGTRFGVSEDTVLRSAKEAAIIDSKPEIAKKVMQGEAMNEVSPLHEQNHHSSSRAC